MRFRKHVHNTFAVIIVALPNLAITTVSIFVLTVLFHWSGFYAVLAYFIGQVFSVQYSVFFNRGVKTEWTVFGRKYHFSEQKQYFQSISLDSPDLSQPQREQEGDD